jgi:hypothetical protein
MSKKTTYISALVIYVIVSIVSFYFFSRINLKSTAIYVKPTVDEQEQASLIDTKGPKTKECPLNGQLYTRGQQKKWEKRRPLGIVIENHLDARPQSGLQNADVIYEAVAEGGITRFLAMYYCEDTAIVGPVRSARIYFVKLLQGYGTYPLYAHVGGANTPGPADALGEIRDLGWDQYNDLNQFGVAFPTYYRDYERLSNRVTEHTMYSGTDKLWSYAAKKRKLTDVDEDRKKWDKEFETWKFKKDEKLSKRGTVSTISFNFWEEFSKDYKVTWKYDKESNSYKRVNGGVPQTDKNTDKQLTFKNIIVVFADETPANDGYEGGHLLYDVVGSGDGLLFQNGNAEKITWKKPDEENAMKFYDKSGAEVELVAGKDFIEILPLGNKVVY